MAASGSGVRSGGPSIAGDSWCLRILSPRSQDRNTHPTATVAGVGSSAGGDQHKPKVGGGQEDGQSQCLSHHPWGLLTPALWPSQTLGGGSSRGTCQEGQVREAWSSDGVPGARRGEGGPLGWRDPGPGALTV